MTHLRTVRLAMLAGTVVATALVLAACGSSSNTSSSSSSSSSSGSAAGAAAGGANAAARTRFVACLKAHGVTLPNRPPGARRRPNVGEGGGFGGGGGFFGGGGNGAPGAAGGARASRLNNPKMRAALQACGAGRFPQRRFTPSKAAVTKFVACVKQHGYNLPAPNFSGKGPIFPASIEHDKKFQAAVKPCASELRPAGAPGSGAGNAGGGASGSGSSSD